MVAEVLERRELLAGDGLTGLDPPKDTDRLPIVSVFDSSTVEGQSLELEFRLDKPSTEKISVEYETIGDTARVLSRYVDAIMIRTTKEEKLLEMAEHATVPVINGLTDVTHPCQLMADVMTYEDHRGPIEGRIVTWLGDTANSCPS